MKVSDKDKERIEQAADDRLHSGNDKQRFINGAEYENVIQLTKQSEVILQMAQEIKDLKFSVEFHKNLNNDLLRKNEGLLQEMIDGGLIK